MCNPLCNERVGLGQDCLSSMIWRIADMNHNYMNTMRKREMLIFMWGTVSFRKSIIIMSFCIPLGFRKFLQVLQANVPFFFYINRVIFHEGKEGRGRRVMINLMILNLNKCPRVGEGPVILWGEGRREVRGVSMFALVLFVLTVSNLLYLHLSSRLVARAASCR